MRPGPVPKAVEEMYGREQRLKKIAVGKPGWSGKPEDEGDGSSSSNAATVEALHGTGEDGWPVFREYLYLTDEDIYSLQEDGFMIEISFHSSQVPVHSMRLVHPESCTFIQED